MYHQLGYPPRRLFFGIEGLKCLIPMVVHPIVQIVAQRTLLVVDLGFQRGVPAELLYQLQKYKI
jgi:hypothetical protein